MKMKILGLVALVFSFTLLAAQSALADGIRGAHDSDFSAPKFSQDISHSPVHNDVFTADLDHYNHGQNGDIKPTFDHILARSTSFHSGVNASTPFVAAPEPSSLLLLAAGLTPFLWMRRRTGGL